MSRYTAAQKYIDAAIGALIKQHRTDKKLSQNEIADLLEVSPQQISKYENGVDSIPHARLAALAEFFSVPMARFFEDLPGMDVFPEENHDNVLSPTDFALFLAKLRVEPSERKRFLEEFRDFSQKSRKGTAKDD